MKFIAVFLVMIYALACGAQTAEPVAAAPAATAVADTNAPPPPPKDPAKCVVARFGFDGSLQPDAAGTVMSVMFKRSSASYLDCAPVNENSPRFVAGRSGKALLVESAYANHFSISQSGAAEAEARLGALLPHEVDRIYLQNDLTAISPGPLASGLDVRLRQLAHRESHAQASSYRFHSM